jgi:hypothetical protein
VLRKRLVEMQQAKREEEIAVLRGEFMKAEWGQVAPTFYPYQMVRITALNSRPAMPGCARW